MQLIDRQSALSVCKEYCWIDDEDFIDGYNAAIKDIREAIKELPIVEAEPVRHGRWIPVTNGRGGHECNQCRNYAPSYQTGKEHLSDYCPHCGARMDGGDDNG